MSNRERPPGAAMERPAATAIANGPEHFGNIDKRKDNTGAAATQELPPHIADFVGRPDFDWNEPDNVLIPEQPPIAVYLNGASTLTIRQRCWPDDDVIVTVNFDCLASLIEGLQRYLPGKG